MSARASARLADGIAQHRAALEHFLSTAAAVPEAAWQTPTAFGKWSPDEISTHLRLALEAMSRELSGGAAMRCVVPWPQRLLLRWTILPRILSTGRFPKGVRAPREVRPSGPALSRAESLARLRAAADSAEAVWAGAQGRRATHAYFGRIPMPELLRLLARHTEHHERQIVGSGDRAPRKASEEEGA